MSPLGDRSLRFFCVKPVNRKVKGNCKDIFAYRKVDRGRTYGPEDRCCLFLTGPVWPAASDGVMFIRSSRVVIVGLRVEDARNERREKGRVARGRRGRK